jgi:hypothetical protein
MNTVDQLVEMLSTISPQALVSRTAAAERRARITILLDKLDLETIDPKDRINLDAIRNRIRSIREAAEAKTRD